MPQPVSVSEAGGNEESEQEKNKYRQLTSRISAKGEHGREIYIYLNACDSLDATDLSSGSGSSSLIHVDVDMEGHRHWRVKLAPSDVLETGRPKPPPPPPSGGG